MIVISCVGTHIYRQMRFYYEPLGSWYDDINQATVYKTVAMAAETVAKKLPLSEAKNQRVFVLTVREQKRD